MPDFSDFPVRQTNTETNSAPRQISSKIAFSGELETTGLFSLPPLGSFAEKWQAAKLESRLRVQGLFSSAGLQASFTADFYQYAPVTDPDPPRDDGIVLRQCWIGYSGETAAVRIGHQLFNWGNADLFPTVNALDRNDFRDLSALDRSLRTSGTFGVNLKLFTGDTSLEAVWQPVFQQSQTAAPGTFWHFTHDDLAGYTITEIQPQGRSADLKNGAVALRWGGNSSGVDFHINWYFGPQRGILLQTTASGTNSAEAKIHKVPVSKSVNIFSADLSFTAGKAAFRVELAWSPDMTTLLRPDTAAVTTAVANLTAAVQSIEINSLDSGQWFSWTAGMDWQLWGSDGRILIEWSHDLYTRNDSLREDFRTADILALMIKDSFLQGKLELQAGAIFTEREGNYLGAAGYTLTWKPLPNFSITQGSFFFAGVCFLQAKFNI